MSGPLIPQANILFRADGGADIGSGHIRRCLTLAMRLRDRGHMCVFACRGLAHSFNALVTDAAFALVELPDVSGPDEAGDAEQVIDATRAYAPFAVVIVDHYRLGGVWEQAMRAVAQQIVVIDDLADRQHDCNVLIDVAPGDQARYDHLVPAACRKLLGPDYALLRPEFRQLRPVESGPSPKLDRILISFGGVDPDNLTGKAIAAIRDCLPDVGIDAVLTSLSPHRKDLEGKAALDSRLNIHVDSSKMAELMQAADLAIGAGGSTSWERACMGLPSIVTVIAENQRQTADALENLGCAVAVTAGPQFASQVGKIVQFLSASPTIRRMMSAAALAAVDGRGADRIASAILPAEVMLRPVSEQDSRQIWEWRNAPEIRSTAIDTSEIPWDSHRTWFAGRIADPQTVMLVAEDRGVGVGVLRYDIDGSVANVSIFLAPGNGGRGMGSAVLRAGESWLKCHQPEIRKLHADVRSENGASIALFKGANYSARLISFERNIND